MAVTLNIREYGRGQPLVILHGLFGSQQNWHAAAERLAERFRVVVCDLRNHGASPWAPTMRFEEMADDLELLIEERGLAPAIVLGHSVGGKTAMLTALRHPDLVEALIVVDIAPIRYEEPFADYIATMRGVDVAAVRKRAEVDALLAPVVADAATRRFLLQNLEERAGGGFAWRLNLASIALSLEALLDFPAAAEATFEGRALFVSGERSDYIGRRTHGRTTELFPQAEFARVPGSGHYPHVEQPDVFLETICGFLDSAYA